jgi:hypothetical protein
MTEGRYRAHGPQAEFEPGSGGRVLRNLLGIKRVRQIEQAESERWPPSLGQVGGGVKVDCHYGHAASWRDGPA